ncbi:MAG: YciI family protein [Gaiellaceae bacterium]
MKYLLAIYGNDDVWTAFPPAQLQQLINETDAHNNSLFASGELVGAYGVADQMQAKKVRVADGATVVTDGPYIEAKEFLGSFYVIDCDGLERAIEIAAEMPSARFTDIEIRPILHEGTSDL